MWNHGTVVIRSKGFSSQPLQTTNPLIERPLTRSPNCRACYASDIAAGKKDMIIDQAFFTMYLRIKGRIRSGGFLRIFTVAY